MKIQISEPATIDLEEIDRFISQDNQNAAKRIVLRVLEAIEYLNDYPNMGRNGRVTNTKELVISGTHFVVIYQIKHQTIFILRVLHSARKWP